jgi:hypothetical protein
MVQDPTCLNDIEATVYRLKLENIGLRIFDVFQPELARFSLGIAETAQTQIDGQHARTWELSRGLDRMLSGATASDEDFRAFCSDDVLNVDKWK